MKILCDYHHDMLYESLLRLFEGRMGAQVYRPIGLDWHTEGYWRVYDHPATAQQYLAVGAAEPLDTHGRPVTESHGDSAWLNKNAALEGQGLYRVGKQKAITLARAKEEKWDLIISSIPIHFELFEKFRKQFCPQAPHVFQQGNMWEVPQGVRNHLNSTKVPTPPGCNGVHYHPEFDVSEYGPTPCANPRSVVNLAHYHQPRYQEEFYGLEKLLKPRGWTFLDHGAGNREGACPDVPKVLRETGFLWHNKAGGEGYGFNPHCAVAMGRPIICHRELYRGMTVADLLVSGAMIDLDDKPMSIIAAQLNILAEQYEKLSGLTRRRFEIVVDFNDEFKQIQDFMGKLQ